MDELWSVSFSPDDRVYKRVFRLCDFLVGRLSECIRTIQIV